MPASLFDSAALCQGLTPLAWFMTILEELRVQKEADGKTYLFETVLDI